MGILNDKVTERRQYLTNEINKLGVYHSNCGRALYMLSLADLEWMHVEEKNKFAKALADNEY